MIADYQYKFNQFPAGVFGVLSPHPNTVCGNLLHLDYYGRPFWVNGGILKDKNANPLEVIRFDSWNLENSIVNKWDKTLRCYGESPVHSLNETELNVIDSLVELWSSVLHP